MTRPGIFGWSYPPGCNSVPGDEPWSRQIKTKVRKAVIDYKCDHCSATLARGTEYRNTLYEIEDGSLYVEHACYPHCPQTHNVLDGGMEDRNATWGRGLKDE